MTWTEEQYAGNLRDERRRFAWVMQHYGGLTAAQAEAAALQRYPYEARDKPNRGLVFHREAWQWALRKIHGDMYWVEHPELDHPPAGYEALE
jgi:hypothetical protein